MILTFRLNKDLMRFRNCARLILAFSLFSIFIFCGAPFFAQDNPDVSQGLNPESTYHGTDFDLVDTVTGRLNLHIPLIVDRSQRGKLNFTYSLDFSGQSWYLKEGACDPTCHYSWSLVKGTNGGLVLAIDGHIDHVLTQTCTVTTCGYVATADVSVSDDGSVHPLGAITKSPLLEESIDGSGIQRTVNSSSLLANFINQDGIQFSEPVFNTNTGAYTKLIEDTNGNEITITGNAFTVPESPIVMTDTLGRAWTQTFGSTNVTGCPTGGPVSATSSTIWTVPGPNSSTRTFKFCISQIPIQTSLGNNGNEFVTQYSSTWNLTTGVVLPDGTTWRIDYNILGDPVKVVLPTGGTVTYTWQILDPCNTGLGFELVSTRTVYDGTNSREWQYSPISGSLAGGFIVTDPLENDTVYNPAPITAPPGGGGQQNGCSLGTGKIQYYAGSHNGGALLKTVTKSYTPVPNPYATDLQGGDADPILLTSTTTTWGSNPATGETNQVQQAYDSGFTFTDTNGCCGNNKNWTGLYGLVATQSRSDFGSGTPGQLISTIATAYWYTTHPQYVAANILNLPSSVITTNVNAYKCSETDYTYDDAGRLFTYTGTLTQHVAPTFSVLGNLTSITRQLSNTPCQANTSWTSPTPSYRNYYNTGMISASSDPLVNITNYAYSSSFYGAYPTTVTNALNQQTNYNYDFNTGLVTAIQDPNDVANGRAGTTYTYDELLRPLAISYPDNGETSIGYNYSGNVFVGDTITKKITSALNQVTSQVFNGLGLPNQTQATVPASTCLSGTSYVDMTYDGDGRQFSVSNPYCTASDTTYGLTSTYYDALNRVTSVVEQDGGTISYNYANFPCTTVTDEAGKARTSCVDGAGRMTSVIEDPGSSPHLNYETIYTYDALADLLSVTQSSSRQRSFSYDSLTHLLSASNPESNTVNYTYDANGNVLTKTDTRGFTINYSPSNAVIDPLNRVRGKTYSNGDPEITYAYDGNTPVGCSPTLSITNGIGMRTGMCDAAGNEGWNYDPMGRVQVDQRTTNSVTLSTTYSYNLDGSIASLIDPSLRTITYTPNDAAQPVSAVDAANNINYVVGPTTCPNGQTPSPAGGVCYTPLGLVAQMVSGQNLVTTSYFNSRLQPCRVAVNSDGTPPGSCSDGTNYGNVLDYAYNFEAGISDNGNVDSITNNLTKYTSTDRSQQFFYDGVNRILEAGTVSTSGANCWGEQYGYDNWGNLQSIGQWAPNYNGCTQESGFSFTPTANNQISGFCYDAAGNLLAYSPSPCTPVYTYNSENLLTSTAGVTYTYDGDGKRVEKSNGTLYWYGTSADPLVETNASGTLLDEYIFFDGKRIAQRDSLNNVQYYFGNHLGSTTVLTESNGVVGFAADYYPFGQERDDPQATNYLLESNAFDQSPWQTWDTGTPTITPNATTAPDGTLAEKVSFPSGAYSRRVQDFNGVVKGGAAGNTFTYSIWMRADTPLTVRFDLEDEVSGNYDHTSGIVNVTTQWQQFSVTRTIRAGASDAWAEIGNHYNDAVTTTFYAWGAQVSEVTIGFSPNFKFTGKEYDSESALNHFGARHFTSLYGRFMTPDPMGGHFTNPQSLNRYSYVHNNPLTMIDPSGLDCVYVVHGADKQEEGYVVSGDCVSENDDGIFVNGKINIAAGASMDSTNNTMSFFYTPDGTVRPALYHTGMPDSTSAAYLDPSSTNYGFGSQNYANQVFSQAYQNSRAIANPKNIASFYGMSALTGSAMVGATGGEIGALLDQAGSNLATFSQDGAQLLDFLSHNPDSLDLLRDIAEGYVPGPAPATLGGAIGGVASYLINGNNRAQISQGLQNGYNAVRGSIPH